MDRMTGLDKSQATVSLPSGEQFRKMESKELRHFLSESEHSYRVIPSPKYEKVSFIMAKSLNPNNLRLANLLNRNIF